MIRVRLKPSSMSAFGPNLKLNSCWSVHNLGGVEHSVNRQLITRLCGFTMSFEDHLRAAIPQRGKFFPIPALRSRARYSGTRGRRHKTPRSGDTRLSRQSLDHSLRYRLMRTVGLVGTGTGTWLSSKAGLCFSCRRVSTIFWRSWRIDRSSFRR
jgi:hypothetical protein